MLTLEAGECLSVLIPDSQGKTHRYAVEWLPNSIRLVRRDTRKEYIVTLTDAGWACGCDAMKYAKADEYECKHIDASRELWQLARLLREELRHDARD